MQIHNQDNKTNKFRHFHAIVISVDLTNLTIGIRACGAVCVRLNVYIHVCLVCASEVNKQHEFTPYVIVCAVCGWFILLYRVFHSNRPMGHLENRLQKPGQIETCKKVVKSSVMTHIFVGFWSSGPLLSNTQYNADM